LWTVKKTRTVTDYRIGQLKITEIISGKYEKSNKVGQWTFKTQNKLNGKNETINEIYNFKNNILVGELNTYSIKGLLNNDGFYIGNWTLTSKEYGEMKLEYIAEFKNNIFLKLIVRQVSDGQILLHYDNSEIVNQFSDTLSQDIIVIAGQRYELKSCENIDRYSNEDNKYFLNFTETIKKKVSEFDKPLRDIPLGSTNYILKSPQLLIKKELTYDEIKQLEDEKQKKEEEEKRITEEKIRIEKERLESIARKQKFEVAVSNGNKLVEQKKYKEALVEYNSANEIESSNDISKKIKATQFEIDRIESLQKNRVEIYSYLKNESEEIKPEMMNLKASLEDKKKVYGQNYEMCMNLLGVNFSSYFLRINTLFSTNKTDGLTIEDSWNKNDQDALDLLLKFNEEFKLYEKFHYAVKSAFDTENKDQLKLLKSSDDPKVIISKF